MAFFEGFLEDQEEATDHVGGDFFEGKADGEPGDTDDIDKLHIDPSILDFDVPKEQTQESPPQKLASSSPPASQDSIHNAIRKRKRDNGPVSFLTSLSLPSPSPSPSSSEHVPEQEPKLSPGEQEAQKADASGPLIASILRYICEKEDGTELEFRLLAYQDSLDGQISGKNAHMPMNHLLMRIFG